MKLQETSIVDPGIRAFVETFIKTNSEIEMDEYFYRLGHSNHEVWRHCIQCDYHWDAKKEPTGVRCPKCGMPGEVG